MSSQSVHSWRLYAPDDADDSLRISNEVCQITASTEPGTIDTWFDDGFAVFGGRGLPPRGPHIKRRACECDGGCEECCFTGLTYHWVEVPLDLVQEAIREIKQIMADLKTPVLP